MKYPLLALTTDAPPGFEVRTQLTRRDLRRTAFALFAESIEAAETAIQPYHDGIAGIIVTYADYFVWEQRGPGIYHLALSPDLRLQLPNTLLPYLELIENTLKLADANRQQELNLARAEEDRVRIVQEFGGLRENLLTELGERRAAEKQLREAHDELEKRVRQRTEELARANESLRWGLIERQRTAEELDLFFTLSLEMLCIADFNGYFKRLNPAWEKTLGYTQEELMGRPFVDFVHPEDREATIAEAAKLTTGVESISFENRYRCKDGSYKWVMWNSAVSVDKQLVYAAAHDITQQRQAEDEIRRAKDAAEAASRAKSEFLANMSHELRTPLNAIIGFSEILEDQAFGELNPRQARYITNILTSGRHLLRLINDILDLAKIEAGRLTLELEQFDVTTALHDVANIVKTLANKKHIALTMETEADLPPITADQPKLKQIMYNLLSNAIKFTPDGGNVTVTASLNRQPLNGQPPNSMMRIAVSDTGIGIKPEDCARVFGEFEQVDSSYARQQQGTGLGLALTRRFVELHGGQIWVESEGEGKGSSFVFVLPLNAHLNAHLNTQSTAQRPEPSTSANTGVAELPESSPATINGSQPMVLVVEDNPQARELLTHYLSESGYAVTCAADGEQALRMARELNLAAITLDIMLPKKSGLEVLAELKSMPDKADIPIIIVSMTEDRQLSFSLGAIDFLVKPVDKNRLIEVVRRAGANRVKAITDNEPLNVLVVDDEPKMVELLTTVLQQEGYHVLQASGGQEAIDLATTHLPDVIILDLMMPQVTGFDVVQQLREHPQARNIPILIFTAKEIVEEDRRQLSNHIQAIMPKSGKEDLLRELGRLTKLPAGLRDTA
jgi:PAS domain S-box-containing protein